MHFYHCPAWMPCLYPSILRPSLITAPFQGSYCLNSQTLPFVCVWNIVFYDLAQVEVSSCLDQEESANCLLRGLMASYLSKVVTSKWKVLCESPWKTKQHHAVVKHLNLCNFPSWLSIDLRKFFFFTFHRWSTKKLVPVVWRSSKQDASYWIFADLSQTRCGCVAAVTMSFCVHF